MLIITFSIHLDTFYHKVTSNKSEAVRIRIVTNSNVSEKDMIDIVSELKL